MNVPSRRKEYKSEAEARAGEVTATVAGDQTGSDRPPRNPRIHSPGGVALRKGFAPPTRPSRVRRNRVSLHHRTSTPLGKPRGEGGVRPGQNTPASPGNVSEAAERGKGCEARRPSDSDAEADKKKPFPLNMIQNLYKPKEGGDRASGGKKEKTGETAQPRCLVLTTALRSSEGRAKATKGKQAQRGPGSKLRPGSPMVVEQRRTRWSEGRRGAERQPPPGTGRPGWPRVAPPP